MLTEQTKAYVSPSRPVHDDHMWNRQRVFDRLVESFDTLSRMPGGGEVLAGLEGRQASVFRPIQSFADAVGAQETRDPRKFPDDWYRPAPPDPRNIDRMYEAWGWVATYVKVPVLCEVLFETAKAKAVKIPITKLVRLKRWGSRQTVYRQRDQASGVVADGLNRDRIFFLD